MRFYEPKPFIKFFLILFCTFYKTNKVKEARFMLRLFFFSFVYHIKRFFIIIKHRKWQL